MVNFYSLELNDEVAVYVRYFRIQPTILLLMFEGFFSLNTASSATVQRCLNTRP